MEGEKHYNRYYVCLLATQFLKQQDVGFRIPHGSPVQTEIFRWSDSLTKKSCSLPQYGFSERVH
jgi:hypothetical protein